MISGISDPICNENYYTFALGRDRKFHVCSNFRGEIVFLRNTRPDEIIQLVSPRLGLDRVLQVWV